MRRYKVVAAAALAIFVACPSAHGQAPSEARGTPDRLRMSISSSLFQGMPEALVIALSRVAAVAPGLLLCQC